MAAKVKTAINHLRARSIRMYAAIVGAALAAMLSSGAVRLRRAVSVP